MRKDTSVSRFYDGLGARLAVLTASRDGVESECAYVMTVSLHVLGLRVSWLRAGRDGSREETQ